MKIELSLEKATGRSPLSFSYTRMVNAGYVGKDQEEVRRHISELAVKGIPAPKSTPTLYPVVCNALDLATSIEVYGGETSGEVEYVLLIVNENEVYVGIGSDHTDRHLEESDIPRSKQICPNIMCATVWPLREIEAHWDDLLIWSRATKNGRQTLYQEGRLGLLLNPAELMDFVKTKISAPLEGIVVFSGTLGMLTDGFIFADNFSAELIDEQLDRRLELSYNIYPMNYMNVD